MHAVAHLATSASSMPASSLVLASPSTRQASWATSSTPLSSSYAYIHSHHYTSMHLHGREVCTCMYYCARLLVCCHGNANTPYHAAFHARSIHVHLLFFLPSPVLEAGARPRGTQLRLGAGTRHDKNPSHSTEWSFKRLRAYMKAIIQALTQTI